MTFQLCLLIVAAALLFNRVLGIGCPFKAKYESPDVKESDVSGTIFL